MNSKVGFLIDPDNDWIEVFVKDFIGKQIKSDCSFSVSKDTATMKGFRFVFILGYTRILGSNFLNGNELNLVIHESNLPSGKGFSPVQWQIVEGSNEITVCLLEASADGIDCGDVYIRDTLKLDGFELLPEIRKKQAEVTFRIIKKFLITHRSIIPQKQKGKESFFSRRTRKDDKLDAKKTLEEQFNLLRIANNDEHPLYFNLGENKYTLKIYKS